jgi:hypothetical protein
VSNLMLVQDEENQRQMDALYQQAQALKGVGA